MRSRSLNAIYDKKSKGAQIRSNIKWIEKGETNSKYFLSLKNVINRRIILKK